MTHPSPERLAMRMTKARDERGALILSHRIVDEGFSLEALPSLARFGPRKEAKARAGFFEGTHMISAHLDIRNPLWVSEMNQGIITDRTATALITNGYDGMACRGPEGVSFLTLSPDQVHLRRLGPAETSRDPWELTAEEFTGPAIVMDTFSIDGNDENYEHLVEALRAEGADLPVLACNEAGWQARWLDDWDPPATLGLFDPDGAYQGFYMDGQIWIEEPARGAGHSAVMINAAADLLGGCPAQNTQGLGFSEAGYAAHLHAHRQICPAKLEEDSLGFEI